MYESTDGEILSLLKKDLEKINTRLKELNVEVKKLNYYKRTKVETIRQINSRITRNATIEQKKQNQVQGNDEEPQAP